MTADQAKRKARVALEVESFAVMRSVEAHASRILKRKVVLRLSRTEQLQILNLRMWAQRRQVSLHYVLQVLLDFWSKRYQVPKRGQGLGVRISTLVGKKSKEILDEAIIRDYPGQENVRELRADLETKAITSEEVMGATGTLHIQDPLQFMKAYRARVQRARAAVDDVQKALCRRPWRTNPYR